MFPRDLKKQRPTLKLPPLTAASPAGLADAWAADAAGIGPLYPSTPSGRLRRPPSAKAIEKAAAKAAATEKMLILSAWRLRILNPKKSVRNLAGRPPLNP